MSANSGTFLSLADKVAIVTGSSRGIGAAIALELAKRGAKVVITYVSTSSEKLVDELIATIKALDNGSSAIKVQADMASVDAPKKIISEATTAFGNDIDILVNNAGVEVTKGLSDATVEDYTKVMDVNVRGVFLMTQAVIPHLRAPGRVINLGSILGRFGNARSSLYGATKAAVEGFTRGCAAEFGALGHTFNVVAPGPTETDMLTSVGKGAGEGFEQILHLQKMLTPLEHRLGNVQDIALVTAMLVEPQSRWITGQTIEATGGLYMN
ncbi:3-ketoacyl-acyl carrier protein reductase [Phlyctema vagabunda]|uniref:3-ketoacyl-acyl carrier protein reductase n=1 Tax=Phlyctema vagabunda TaxID=108571 RepID=A0ABR4PX05_9HELO